MTALASGSSSAAALLKLVNPSIATISMRSRQVWGWEASQVLKTPLERPGIMSRSRQGPRRSRTGVTSKITVTHLSPYGVWRHTCSSTPMTRTPSNRVGSLISRRAPSTRTAVLAALPGHVQGLGDALHCQMMNDQTSQRPAHRRPRELGAQIGRLAHAVVTPGRTAGTGSGARSRARSWGATRRARARGAWPACHDKCSGTRSVDTTGPHQRSGMPTLYGLAKCAGLSLPGPGHPGV